jgi:hypothetical protein
LALLHNFDASGEMAWGAAVLAHLYRELGKASMKGKANCCAFLTLLQVVCLLSSAEKSLSSLD